MVVNVLFFISVVSVSGPQLGRYFRFREVPKRELARFHSFLSDLSTPFILPPPPPELGLYFLSLVVEGFVCIKNKGLHFGQLKLGGRGGWEEFPPGGVKRPVVTA